MLIFASDSLLSVHRLMLNAAEPRLSLTCHIPLHPGKNTKAAKLRWATWASDSSAVLLIYTVFDPTHPSALYQRPPQVRLTRIQLHVGAS